MSNYTKYRHEFINLLEGIGPLIYIAFFTLAGASLSLDVLWEVGMFAFILFVVRLLTIIMGAYVGSTLAKDSSEIKNISWMPYVTQAGVGLGLATIVESAYPIWGNAFATLVIGVIVINQVVGPPFVQMGYF